MRISVATTINRPVAEVFAFQADGHLENHPRWDPSVVRIEPVTPAPLRLGSRFAMTRKMMGREERHEFQVVEWDAPHRFGIETRSPNFRLRIVATCTPIDGGRTHLVVAGEAKLGGARRLLAPLMRPKLLRDSRGNVRRVKELIEADAVSPVTVPA